MKSPPPGKSGGGPVHAERGATNADWFTSPGVVANGDATPSNDLHDLSVADIVAASGLPRWKLESRFKRCVGHSIHDDIVRTRLTAAMVLVRTTALPLKAIAPRAGFQSASYMITMFKRHFGITPAKLRRHEQANVVQPGMHGDE